MEDDAYIKPVEGEHWLKCPSCDEYRPQRMFNKKLTRAQSQAMGYAGFNRLEVQAKHCKYCRRRERKPSELSRKEIMSRVGSGDLNKFIADSMLRRMDADARAAKRRAVNARWEAQRAKPWRFMVLELGKEIIAVRHQILYVQKQLNKLAGDAELADKLSANRKIKAYLDAYMHELLRLRGVLRIEARHTRKKYYKKPESIWWPKHMDAGHRERVLAMWHDCDTAMTVRMRAPLLAQWANEPEGLTAHIPDNKDTDEDSDTRLADAKARLAKPTDTQGEDDGDELTQEPPQQ